MQEMISQEDLVAAAERLAGKVHRTPVFGSGTVNQLMGASLYFKCENFQRVGAFKFRGATNALALMGEAELEKGVVTHSSGNHAQALALAAREKGVPAYIVMPSNAPQIKQEGVAGFGAEIILCEPTLEARESTAKAVIERTGASFVHPYNDERIIAGQSTAAQELLEEVPDLDIIMTPVGGGGLLSGTALAAHYFAPRVRVLAGEPLGADDAFRSLQAGTLIPSVEPKTIADGLLTSLGSKTFPIIQSLVDQIATVSEENIVKAMRMIWEKMKIIVEASAAVPLGALMEGQIAYRGKKVGIILSGGNVDLGKLPWNCENCPLGEEA